MQPPIGSVSGLTLALGGRGVSNPVELLPTVFVFVTLFGALCVVLYRLQRDRPETSNAFGIARVGSAWRDDDLLVVSLTLPMPPLCVFCGRPSTHVATRRMIWNERRRISSLQLAWQPFPLCEEHWYAHRRWLRQVAAAMISFYVVLFGAVIATFNGYPLALVGVALMQITVVLVAKRGRSVCLRLVHVRRGYAWLDGAGIDYLMLLPPAGVVAPPTARSA